VKLIWQNPDGETQSLEIQKERYDLGRGESADIQIADENASRIHARLSYDAAAGILSIEDLDSRNGVFVNGERIEAQTRLQADDVILVGATAMTVQMEDAAAEEATAINDADPQRTRVMSLDDIAALIDEGSSSEDEENTHEMDLDLDATMALDEAQIDLDPTELYEPSSAQPVEPAYKLLVASGEFYGQTFALEGSPLIIGRKPDCDIVLSEGAVSGQHAQVRLAGERVLLSDLGSKNGTLMADNSISGETELAVGTTFTVGATDFKLLNGDTFVSAEKRLPGLRKKKKMLAMGALALLLLLLAGGKLLVDRQPPTPEVQTAAPGPQTTAPTQQVATSQGASDDGLQPLQALASSTTQPEDLPVDTAGALETGSDGRAEDRSLGILRETADAFLENRLWSAAIDKLKTIQERDPQSEEISQMLQRAEFERANQERFDKGLSLAARSQFEAAKSTFAAITEDSVYHDEALLELQNVERAAKKATQNAAQNAAQERARKQTPSVNKSASTAAKTKPATPKKPSPERLVRRHLDAARQAYMRGDIPAARKEAAAAKTGKLGSNHALVRQAQKLEQQLQRAASGFEQGEQRFKADDVSGALKIWADVLALDREIAGSSESAYSRRIAAYMATHFYTQAQQAFAAQEWAAARNYTVKTLKARPGHTGGRSLIRKLNNQAKKLYEEGYILEDLNPTKAAERWRQVLKVASPDNEYYRKAREKLAKYGG
jgi:pSer/pThr/pTyr-binding forkhead associated (FHA) protein